ncbi:hypothetical protein GECvBGOT_gp044 [Salmonella phage GEC_vB_GOT]|nr:hypothetical protein GECvBGOT_gp044 [Salmonella phage GEC_vB_GOT]
MLLGHTKRSESASYSTDNPWWQLHREPCPRHIQRLRLP